MVSWSIAKIDQFQWLVDQLQKLVDQLQWLVDQLQKLVNLLLTIEIWSIAKLIFWSIASSSIA